MNSWDKSQIQKIHNRYNPEHDLGGDAPIHWSVEALADVIEKMDKRIEALEAELEERKAEK